MKPRAPRLPTLFFILLLGAATLTSGCVYLRLLQLKNQLADFDKNFSADTTAGLRINFKAPVLFGDDLRWLGAEPETVRKTEETEAWIIRWVKELPPTVKEEGVYDVIVEADLHERRVHSVLIPERYFAYVPKDLFVGALRSAGHAKIDRQSRQAVMDTGNELTARFQPADISSIEKMLGVPTQRTAEADLVRYRYIFRPQTQGPPGKPVEVTFVFDSKTGLLRRLVGKLPKGTLSFDFAKPTAEKK